MTKPKDALFDVTHTVAEGVEKLRLALAREWQAVEDASLDRAHGATRDDRPSAGYHPCEPADVAEPAARHRPDAKPH